MPKPTKPPRPIPLVDINDAHALVMRLDEITARYQGPFDELESAIGMYMVGRLMGWKVLLIIHNKRTIRKYEEILGINVREEFQEEGPFADKSIALTLVKKLGGFWKAVSGEHKDEELKEKRRELLL
ncbi:MAG: hypothetical protein WCL27_11840 [Betaproteobacteria bacterium]